jgi:hypothetical protein
LFLGNFKAENYEPFVVELSNSYKVMRCILSLKIHSLDSYDDLLPTNLEAVSGEHGVRFHQEIPYNGEATPGNVEPHHVG